jgi:NADH:ubiquinone oxidoreductase subunit E
MTITVCVGSSCHIKGSQEIIELLEKAVTDGGLKDEITLSGSFCAGKCNRTGVTISVDEQIYAGITPDGFTAFWNENVMKPLKTGG